MKALITGSTGFVGPYLKKELEGHGYKVFGLARNNPENFENVFRGDIRDSNFVNQAVKKILPDEVYHLAGFSSVKKSFEDPELTMEINLGGTKNLLEAITKFCPCTKILIVSSTDVYGKPKHVPISENEETHETSPYSKSRIAQEKLVKEYDSLNIIISRSFSHTGPGQQEIFVLSDFVKQVIDIEKGIKKPIVFTGNISFIRDFSDVRDVVRAYYLLLLKGKRGETYNVGSGIGYKLRELLEKIIDLSKIKIEIKQDESKMRPVDIAELVADISKIETSTGWKPIYSIDRTICDLLDYWRLKL